MDRIKELREKIGTLKAEMKVLNENRNFEAFDKRDEELRELLRELKTEERMIELINGEPSKSDNEERGLAELIREAASEKREYDLSNIEVRAISLNAGSSNTDTKNIAKTTFSDSIIQKLPYISELYKYCREEKLGSATHSIPVQKTKIGKFVKMKELANYAAQNADYSQVKLEAVKFGNLVVISDECIKDTGYDIVKDVEQQIYESYGETLDELLVKGEDSEGVEGLEKFDGSSDGSAKITQAALSAITLDEINSIYYKLPRKYRKEGVWVMNDDTVRALDSIKDKNGRPLLKESYAGSPFGDSLTLYNRPVVVNDNVDLISEASGKSIFFGDLNKALIVAPRNSITIQKSDEYGWINDSVAFKANIRLDIKRAVGEALVYLENASS